MVGGAPQTRQGVGGMEQAQRILFSSEIQKPYIVSMAALLEARGLTVELPTAGGWVRPGNALALGVESAQPLGGVGHPGTAKPVFSPGRVVCLPRRATPTGRARGR